MSLRPEEIIVYGAVWRQRWEATLEACTRLGGDPKGFYLALSDEGDGEVLRIETDFLIAPPATESAILALENTLERPIPAELREILLHFSAEVNFGWQLPVNFDTPAILKEVCRGDCRWSLEDIVGTMKAWDNYFQGFSDEKLSICTKMC